MSGSLEFKTFSLSCKVSGVQDLIAVYQELAQRCDNPLHLGLTEAGIRLPLTPLSKECHERVLGAMRQAGLAV